MAMRKLIMFNGPPRSGKDTAANYIYAKLDRAAKIKLSAPLKAAVKAFFNLSDAQVAYLEGKKEDPDDLLFGWSYRNTQIDLSEEWAKRCFSPTVFGRLACRNVVGSTALHFITSDTGFAFECLPLIEQFGSTNCLLIRLHREGCNFDGDSRSYIDLPNVLTVDLHNNGELHSFQQQVETVVMAWLNQ